MSKKDNYETVEEKVKFLTLGKKNVKKADTSYVIEKGETVEGLITEVKDSELYKKVFTLKVAGETDPVIVTGKTDLLNKFGFGKMDIPTIKVGDTVRITWKDTYKSKQGTGFKFDVGIKRC